MDIIKELWYGNVAPFEQCTRGDRQMKELLSLMARNRDELGEGVFSWRTCSDISNRQNVGKLACVPPRTRCVAF